MDGKEKIKMLLQSDYKYIILASVISADANYDEESIRKNLKMLELIKESLDNDISDADEIAEFVEQGFQILNRDLEEYINSDKPV